jgi:hypothetical protein
MLFKLNSEYNLIYISVNDTFERHINFKCNLG